MNLVFISAAVGYAFYGHFGICQVIYCMLYTAVYNIAYTSYTECFFVNMLKIRLAHKTLCGDISYTPFFVWHPVYPCPYLRHYLIMLLFLFAYRHNTNFNAEGLKKYIRIAGFQKMLHDTSDFKNSQLGD